MPVRGQCDWRTFCSTVAHGRGGTLGRSGQKEALPSDVLVQFWWRTARARILGRRGSSRRPRSWAGMPWRSPPSPTHPATAHALTLRSPRSSPWPPSGHPPGQKQRRRGSSCARKAPRLCSSCTGRRRSPAAERKRSSEWSSSCLTAVRYRRCRHHHRASSAWRTSFRAATVGGAPNGAVTTP